MDKSNEEQAQELKTEISRIFRKLTKGQPHDHAFSDLCIAQRDFERAMDAYCAVLAERKKKEE